MTTICAMHQLDGNCIKEDDYDDILANEQFNRMFKNADIDNSG